MKSQMRLVFIMAGSASNEANFSRPLLGSCFPKIYKMSENIEKSLTNLCGGRFRCRSFMDPVG